MEDLTQQQRVAQAKRLQGFLDEPAVVAALDTLKQEAIRRWVAGGTTEAREEAWFDYQAALRYGRRLQAVVQDGDLAARDLSRP